MTREEIIAALAAIQEYATDYVQGGRRIASSCSKQGDYEAAARYANESTGARHVKHKIDDLVAKINLTEGVKKAA